MPISISWKNLPLATLFLVLSLGSTLPVWGDTGLVHLNGNTLTDDQGPFLALGATYFLALRHEKYEEAQLQANLAFLSQQGFDYIRILSMVGWSGREILPPNATSGAGWSDYWSQLGQLVDRVYDVYGMRTQITVFADAGYIMNQGTNRTTHVANLLSQVVSGREHKIILIEVANEYWQNGLTLSEVRQHGATLANNTNVLIALSSPHGGKTQANSTYSGSAADIATIHFSRAGGWVSIFDCENIYTCSGCLSGLPMRASNNEPIGAGSSVQSETNPVRLTMAAAISWQSGLPMHVFHSRPGITADNANLPPPYTLNNPKSFQELFQKLGLTGRFNYLKNLLPANLPDWARTVTQGTGNPFVASAGIYRSPASLSGADFLSFPSGVADSNQTLTATTDLTDVKICSLGSKACTFVGYIPQGTPIRPRTFYDEEGLVITGKKGPIPPDTCKGVLDYRGDNCNDLKRYQCDTGTDCSANACTYQGAPCLWKCRWEPNGYTCENTCDSKAFVSCIQRPSQSFCEKGWGCYWGATPPPSCQGTLDYRGDNCNDFKRYQCSPGADCDTNSCTYQGAPCHWECRWEPDGYTCEDTCDSKALAPCHLRPSKDFCQEGWGCSWL